MARNRGQSLVELAISLPMLLMLILGVIDLGRAFYYREQVGNAARQAMRLASSPTYQSTGDAVCASGGTASAPLPPPSSSPILTIANAAALENSSTGSPAGSSLSGATITVIWHCRGGSAVTNSTNQGVTDPSDPRSDAIEVRVTYPMTILTPLVSQMIGSPSASITDDVVGRAEY